MRRLLAACLLMGIKPGSAEFHALKGQMGKSKGRYAARGNGAAPAARGGERDDDRDEGPGSSGKSKDKGKSKGKP